jgi:prostaglandin-E synthase 1
MDTFIGNPAFRSYAFCAAILGLKMLLSAVYTGRTRQRVQGYINAEDASTFGEGGVAAGAVEAPEVAHALRIQRNDLENIPLFFAIGLIYFLCGFSHFKVGLFCWTFTLARLAHTYCYMHQLQPGRAISFTVGAIATLLMIIQILWTTL